MGINITTTDLVKNARYGSGELVHFVVNQLGLDGFKKNYSAFFKYYNIVLEPVEASEWEHTHTAGLIKIEEVQR